MSSALTRNLMAIVVLTTILGCARESAPPVPIISGSLPELREYLVPGLDSTGPDASITTFFAVARDGRLAFTKGFNMENRFITIVDTTGKVERFGRLGQGPGEFSPMVNLGFGEDDALIAFDAVQARVVVRTREGMLTTSDLKLAPGMLLGTPVRLDVDSIDVLPMDLGTSDEIPLVRSAVRPATQKGLARISVRSSGQRTVLSPAESAYVALLARSSVGGNYHVIASRGDRVVLANTYTYSFQSFDADGRPLQSFGKNLPERFLVGAELDSVVAAGGLYGGSGTTSRGRAMRRPTAPQEREQLAAQPQRYFSSIAFDDAGRLWAFGRLDANSSFADIYADTTFLGRRTIPCALPRYDASLRGPWLAVMCTAPGTDAGSRLRLFR